MTGNVPLAPTRLVGRARQLIELEQLVAEAPVVTVVGAGGVGKTRLAIELARTLSSQFPAGVWLADLAPVRSAGVVEAEVAALLGAVPGGGDTVALIAEQLRDRRVLVVLDNCEHVIDPVARFTRRLIGECAGLRVVATSRVPLGISGEVTYPLAPLDSGGATEPFRERARAADPAFAVAASDGPVLAALCDRLDRIPLAIELAAPWVRVFTLAELLPQVSGRVAEPALGRRDLPDRQRSMRATVEWSYRLLPEPQQVLLRRLSVFAGTFSLDAVEVVCGWEPVAPGSVASLLAGLRARSVLVVERHGAASRYRLLETLRDFALGRARDSGEHPELQRRHAAYYLLPGPRGTDRPAAAANGIGRGGHGAACGLGQLPGGPRLDHRP